MEEEKVSYETAKLATEKGFNCFDIKNNYVYCEREDSIFYHKPVSNFIDDSYNKGYLYRTPTQSFLQTWLRVTHNIHVNVFEEFGNYILLIHNYDSAGSKVEIWKHKGPHSSYEKGLEMGLFEALKLIKE